LIDQALIENPVLEEATEEAEPFDERLGPDAPQEAIATPETLAEAQPAANEQDWEQYIASGSGVIPERFARDDGEESSLEATFSRGESLHEHLQWQLEMSSLSALEMAVGEILIGNLDQDGYLAMSIQEILEDNPGLHKEIARALKEKSLLLPPPANADPALFSAKHIPASAEPPSSRRKRKEPPVFEEEEASAAQARSKVERIRVKPEVALAVEAVLRQIQQLDPMGVGARSLQECLEIQLRLMGLASDLAYQIVHHDLKLLENKDLRKIARRRKAELEQVIEAYKLIMALEPKPGRPFERERAQTIIPDVYVYKVHAEGEEGKDRVGQYRVVLNESGMPRLRISEYYRELAGANPSPTSLTHEYIQEKIKAGNWLMKSIEQRQKTILRVTRSILKHQYDFFEKGIHYLKPLVLKDVAEDIEVHESTVSRITTNKYVHSPQGIFELKFFFTSGIDQGQGEVISSKKIKDMILRIISGEDPREPLTDIQIAERLSKESKIRVARRTVAKYREALNLLPSNKRKKMF
jgi:RNA polymerase sigma-54 factor